MPMPGAAAFPFVAFPRGACGTTIWATWEGLCIGWMGAEAGESFGMEVEDMVEMSEYDMARSESQLERVGHVTGRGHVTVS